MHRATSALRVPTGARPRPVRPAQPWSRDTPRAGPCYSAGRARTPRQRRRGVRGSPPLRRRHELTCPGERDLGVVHSPENAAARPRQTPGARGGYRCAADQRCGAQSVRLPARGRRALALREERHAPPVGLQHDAQAGGLAGHVAAPAPRCAPCALKIGEAWSAARWRGLTEGGAQAGSSARGASAVAGAARAGMHALRPAQAIHEGNQAGRALAPCAQQNR